VLGRAIEYDEPSLDELLSARHFVSVRKTPGGPAPSEIARAIAASRTLLESDTRWIAGARAKLQKADEALTQAASAL
jgi:argininosuccinate lyase